MLTHSCDLALKDKGPTAGVREGKGRTAVVGAEDGSNLPGMTPSLQLFYSSQAYGRLLLISGHLREITSFTSAPF